MNDKSKKIAFGAHVMETFAHLLKDLNDNNFKSMSTHASGIFAGCLGAWLASMPDKPIEYKMKVINDEIETVRGLMLHRELSYAQGYEPEEE